MKLFNEKTVSNLPLQNRPDKDGYLHKRGIEYNVAFKKRYFVLLSNMLYYYDKRGDKEPIGVIVLEGHTIELFDDAERPHTFLIRYPDDALRQYVLAAESAAEANSWMHALLCAGTDYTRITLEELEAQLQRNSFEIPEMPDVTPLRSPSIGAEGGLPRENPFGDCNFGFRVTAHFPTFLHFHEAIEQALCAKTPPETKRNSAVAEADNLIQL